MVHTIRSELAAMAALSAVEKCYGVIVLLGLAWYGFNAPTMVMGFFTFLIGAYLFRMLSGSFGSHISYRQLMIFVVTTTILFGRSEASHALFLSDLEDFIISVFGETSNQMGGEAAVDESIINLLFNVLRGIFLLAVGAATLFAISQAMRGGDWLPIIQQVVMAFAAVMAVDIITLVIVGGTSDDITS